MCTAKVRRGESWTSAVRWRAGESRESGGGGQRQRQLAETMPPPRRQTHQTRPRPTPCSMQTRALSCRSGIARTCIERAAGWADCPKEILRRALSSSSYSGDSEASLAVLVLKARRRSWSGEISSHTLCARPSSSSSANFSPASITCSRRTGLASSREERRWSRSCRDCSCDACRAAAVAPSACRA